MVRWNDELLEALACDIEGRPQAPGPNELAPFIKTATRSAGALVLELDDAGRDIAEAFVAAEQVCCSNIGWQLEHAPSLRLRITGTREQLEVLTDLVPSHIPNRKASITGGSLMTTNQQIKKEVRKRYGRAATRVKEKSTDAGCCGGGDGAISSSLYTTDEIRDLPREAVVASLGCGNPVAVADLHEGETVLDLGSGGGIDVLLSARRVGPTGRAYGLDMTDEMLDLARENARKAGVSNVVFLKGEMENVPLPNNEADVIISNCVVNLSPDKDAVLCESFRVLKAGGRLAISDIVTRGTMPAALQKSLEAWTGCIAGALTENDYRAKLAAAGFEGIDINPFREYTAADAVSGGLGDTVRELGKAGTDGLGIFSAVVRATKPEAAGRQASPDTIEFTSVSNEQACGPGECC